MLDDRHKIRIWTILDGKTGHESQARGLLNALEGLASVESSEIQPIPFMRALFLMLFAHPNPWSMLPGPDLLVGVGSRTHLTLLAASRACGGRSIVLMKPSLPIALFDLCLVPEHDGLAERENLFITQGVLCDVSTEGSRNKQDGLIMLGGPSVRHAWEDDAILNQVMIVLATNIIGKWTLTTSRRTPLSFLQTLRRFKTPNLKIVPVEKTGPGWVSGRLADSGVVWVSEDSVSMVYEALTSGARVGLLQVPRLRKEDRVLRGIDALVGSGMVTTFKDWQTGQPLTPPTELFDEAGRCAKEIMRRWFEYEA